MNRNAASLALTLLCLLLLAACGESTQTASEPEETKPDVLASLDGATLVNVAFESGEKFALQKPAQLATLKKLITSESAAAYKCGYDGKVSFRKGGEFLMSAEFNLGEKCRHIAYMNKGELETRIMSVEGIRLLEGLRQSSGPGHVAADLSGMRWMLGRWEQAESESVVSYEEWEERDGQFTGHAYTMEGKDTVFVEKLALELEAGKIYYIPTIPSNDGPVRFQLTSTGPQSAVFENPAHDFPQMITYKLVEDSILHARISGTQNGKEGFKDFFMKRAR